MSLRQAWSFKGSSGFYKWIQRSIISVAVKTQARLRVGLLVAVVRCHELNHKSLRVLREHGKIYRARLQLRNRRKWLDLGTRFKKKYRSAKSYVGWTGVLIKALFCRSKRSKGTFLPLFKNRITEKPMKKRAIVYSVGVGLSQGATKCLSRCDNRGTGGYRPRQTLRCSFSPLLQALRRFLQIRKFHPLSWMAGGAPPPPPADQN